MENLARWLPHSSEFGSPCGLCSGAWELAGGPQVLNEWIHECMTISMTTYATVVAMLLF